MQEQVAIWGWDGVAPWVPVHVDAAGDLQVDVLTSALPAGGATAANQALIIAGTGTLVANQGHCYGYDGANWQTMLVGAPADAFATPAHALEVMSFLMGYNGATWDMLRMESGAWHNLRVAIYDGAQQAYVGSLGADNVSVSRNGLTVMAHLYGFDGTNWDRLRVDAAQNLTVAVNEVRKTDTSTIAQVAVGVASTAVLAANANRIFAELVNDSANVIYLALGAAAVMNRGIRLNANGGSFEIGLTNLYTGAVKAIAGVAASNLTVSEG